MGNVRVNLTSLERLKKNIEKLGMENKDKFYESCLKEMAARLLSKVIKRTPVGASTYAMVNVLDSDGNTSTYKKGKNKGKVKKKKEKRHHGGTLRRGWTTGTISKAGGVYNVEIINPVLYASYVEYGHRTRGRRGWVTGKFMLTISVQELESEAPAILERKLTKFLKEILNDE